MSIASDIARTVTGIREQVSALHAELVRYGLVAWTAGNVSARVPGADLMVIKPSGVAYDDLTPATMGVCGLDGTAGDRQRSPPREPAPPPRRYPPTPHGARA